MNFKRTTLPNKQIWDNNNKPIRGDELITKLVQSNRYTYTYETARSEIIESRPKDTITIKQEKYTRIK